MNLGKAVATLILTTTLSIPSVPAHATIPDEPQTGGSPCTTKVRDRINLFYDEFTWIEPANTLLGFRTFKVGLSAHGFYEDCKNGVLPRLSRHYKTRFCYVFISNNWDKANLLDGFRFQITFKDTIGVALKMPKKFVPKDPNGYSSECRRQKIPPKKRQWLQIVDKASQAVSGTIVLDNIFDKKFHMKTDDGSIWKRDLWTVDIGVSKKHKMRKPRTH